MRGSWRRPSNYIKGNRIPPLKALVEDVVVDLSTTKTQQKDKEEE